MGRWEAARCHAPGACSRQTRQVDRSRGSSLNLVIEVFARGQRSLTARKA